MSICLNMIVKNESKIISRAIDSVLPIIDSWCIIDTGSNDNTVEIIEEKLSHLPGKVISRPWVNFGHNRTEAFQEARDLAQWILLIDADMQVVLGEFNKDELNPEDVGYRVMQKNSALSYYNVRLINSKFDWECVGVTHEYFTAKGTSLPVKNLDSFYINDIGDGGAKADKFERDIRLLTQGLIDEPGNPRYLFYLAQSYKDTQQFSKAIEYYKQRIDAGGWYEEVWYSHYMIAQCYFALNDINSAEEWVNKGYSYYPKRSEAIYELCKAYRIAGNHKKAYEYYLLGKAIPFPKDDLLFISHQVYDHLFDYELTIIHYYIFPTDRVTGLRKSIEYLDKRLDNTVYQNCKFYLTNLSKRATSIIELDAAVPEGFTNTSPCHLRLRDGREVTNIRQVNYSLNREFGSYHYIRDGRHMSYENTLVEPIQTKNYLLGSGEMEEVAIVTTYPNSTIVGLEDIRLFQSGAIIRFFATTRHLDPNYRNRIATGEYDTINRKMIVTKVFDSPFGAECEKNWIAFNEHSIIYSWSPIRLYSYPEMKLEKTISTPKIFNHFRGSSAPVKYCGLNWLVTHSVIYENPRTYMHYLVALDDSANPVMWSLPFSFEGEKIEYCLSLDIKDGIVDFYYSTWDSSSKRMSISFSFFREHFLIN